MFFGNGPLGFGMSLTVAGAATGLEETVEGPVICVEALAAGSAA
ncbi:hypothetical protein [Acetobacter papayae]|nr:hypothetical protein [Acetobacter papayae]